MRRSALGENPGVLRACVDLNVVAKRIRRLRAELLGAELASAIEVLVRAPGGCEFAPVSLALFAPLPRTHRRIVASMADDSRLTGRLARLLAAGPLGWPKCCGDCDECAHDEAAWRLTAVAVVASSHGAEARRAAMALDAWDYEHDERRVRLTIENELRGRPCYGDDSDGEDSRDEDGEGDPAPHPPPPVATREFARRRVARLQRNARALAAWTAAAARTAAALGRRASSALAFAGLVP